MFEFTVTGKLTGRGRTGVFNTPHGQIKTPVFMPVGTAATVKSLTNEQIKSLGAQIILANNYHLYLRPGSDTVEKLGGVHNFMNIDLPILTDSGGFQVWSLGQSKAGLTKINPDGVEFKSHLDGSKHFFSPEVAIESQIKIGADIIMAFDQCTSDAASYEEAKQALDLTQSWLTRSIKTAQQFLGADDASKSARSHAHASVARQLRASTDFDGSSSERNFALFGIIQGALHRELRRDATEFVVAQNLPGIAIGGETIGYNMDGTEQVMDWIYDLLPEDKPRYTMGLGLRPSDIVRAVLAGVDMFDCVAPTRLARNGSLYVGHLEFDNDIPKFVSPSTTERINIGNQQYAVDTRPIDDQCDCYTCTYHSRAYVHHLFRTDELLYNTLASIHNLRMMIRVATTLSASRLQN